VALAGAGLLAWGLAIAVTAEWHQGGLADTFVVGGVVLVLVAAFYRRMYGRTTVGPDGLDTTIAPTTDVAVRWRAEHQDAPPQESADPSTLSARWPTLDEALRPVPPGWTKERLQHADGHEYFHIRSQSGAFDVVINVAACDSPAPRWLLAAINGMTNPDR